MLSLEFKDAIFDKHRNYKVSKHDDGTISLEDKTEYLQEGTKINALLMKTIVDEINRNTPVGVIHEFAGANAPDGYLLCHGQAISRTDYDSLFSVIGITYGSGDGSTTFNLPDFRNKFLMGNDDALGGKGGSSTAILKVANLPAHNHGASVTINSAGAHGHTASSASAGAHAHSASSASAGAHTHSVSGSAASAGAHTHVYDGPPAKGGTTAAAYDGVTTNTYYRTGILSKTSTSAGGHTHSVSGTAGSAGGHSHTITVNSGGAHSHTITVNSGGAHTHTGSVSIGNTGNGEAFSIIPPFIRINYIIKY